MSLKHFNYELACCQQVHLHSGCRTVPRCSALVAIHGSGPCSGPVLWAQCLGKATAVCPWDQGLDPAVWHADALWLQFSGEFPVTVKRLPVPCSEVFTPQPHFLLASEWNVSAQDPNRVYTGSGPSCCQTRSPWGTVPWPPSLWDWIMEKVGACEGWCSLAWSPSSPPLGAESQPLEEIEVWRAPKPSGSHRPGSSMWHVVLDVRSCLLGIIVLWFARCWTSVLRKAKAPCILTPGTGVGCHFLLQGSFTGEEMCS